MIKLYEGKAKIIYQSPDPEILIAHFKDDATAFNAQKRGQIADKGAINCTISARLFQYLAELGIPNHFIDQLSPREIRVRALKIIPLEVVVRNLAAGSLCAQTGLPLATPLNPPLVDFYYKNDALGDPLLTIDRLQLLNLARLDQVDQIYKLALQVNEILGQFFQACGVTLVDFKLEFGCDAAGALVLGDEISPDTCRLWDQTQADPQERILDKDRFRQDLGNVSTAYQRVLDLVLSHPFFG